MELIRTAIRLNLMDLPASVTAAARGGQSGLNDTQKVHAVPWTCAHSLDPRPTPDQPEHPHSERVRIGSPYPARYSAA